MCKVFAIYPTDKKDSTKFLNKINTFLCKNLGADWHCYKIEFSDEDHQRCLNSAQSSAAKFIIFMGHGRGDKLLGSFNKKAEDFISNDALSEELFYKNEKFIHEQNIDFFKNKILFCFSCNSNENKSKSLSRIAIQKGVKSFIGFGDMPTDYIAGRPFPLKAIETYKCILTRVIKNGLYIAIKKEYTIDEFIRLLKILVTKEMQSILFTSSKYRHKKVLLQELYKFKTNIKVYGNRYERLV